MNIEAENARLREALNLAWEHAKAMRNANHAQGPHPDRKDNTIWSRALYHEGKDLMQKLMPYRAVLTEESRK